MNIEPVAVLELIHLKTVANMLILSVRLLIFLVQHQKNGIKHQKEKN
jgi:hypothetical protein